MIMRDVDIFKKEWISWERCGYICHQNPTFNPHLPFHPSSKFCNFYGFQLFFWGGGRGSSYYFFFPFYMKKYRVNYWCGEEGLKIWCVFLSVKKYLWWWEQCIASKFMVFRKHKRCIGVTYFPTFEGGRGKLRLGQCPSIWTFLFKASFGQKMV